MRSDLLSAKALELFGRCRSITVVTGAGISIASGVPAFNGPGAITEYQGREIPYLLSRAGWETEPVLVEQLFTDLRNKILKARPGIAHQTIVSWKTIRFFPAPLFRFTLLSYNFDGLHQAIGNHDVVELQGSIWRLRCDGCQNFVELVPFRHLRVPNNCQYCSGTLRTDISFYQEYPPMHINRKAIRAVETTELFIAIGLSGENTHYRYLVNLAKRNCLYLIEINPQSTHVSHLFDNSIAALADEILPLFYWDYLPEGLNQK